MTAKTTAKAADSKRPSVSQRPLSPHLQVWRWHATMASSIAHRASGAVNYAGAILFTIRVCLDPLTALDEADRPRLAAAWRALGPSGRAYKGWDALEPLVTAAFARWAV